MKRVRIAVLAAALWASSCTAAFADSVETAKQQCANDSFTLAQRVLYAKNVLEWPEKEVHAAVDAGELVRKAVHEFIRAMFAGEAEASQTAIRQVYATCVAVRSGHAKET